MTVKEDPSFFLVVMSLLIGTINFSYAGDPYSKERILRLDTDAHLGKISSIGVDKNCTKMITGSSDKTAKLWNLQYSMSGTSSPSLLATFRPPLDKFGHNGRIAAVAINPAGTTVAVSGYTPSLQDNMWSIFIFGTETGEIDRVLISNRSRVRHLVFSNDGKYLAATTKSDGASVWRTEDWKSIPIENDNYGESYGAAFDRKGRLYTVAYDKESPKTKSGWLRRYSSQNFELEAKHRVGHPKNSIPQPEPYGLAVHPNLNLVAVSLLNKPGIFIFESNENGLKYFDKAETSDLSPKTRIGKISWSTDGSLLVAAGGYRKGRGPILFRVWETAALDKVFKEIEGPSKVISRIMPCGELMAFGSWDPMLGLFDPKDDRKFEWKMPQFINWESNYLRVSRDGLTVSFELAKGDPIVFKVGGPKERDALKLLKPGIADQDLIDTDDDSLPITGWYWGDTRSLDCGEPPTNPLYDMVQIVPWLEDEAWSEKKRASNDEQWSSLAIHPNGEDFYLGTEWYLRAYKSSQFGEVCWAQPVPAKVKALNVAAEGDFLIAALDDGTVRWYDASNGHQLLTLFVNPYDRRWVVWTKSGYFYASAGGENMLGWHENRGPIKNALFLSVDKVRDEFSDINLIKRILVVRNEENAIKQIETESTRKYNREFDFPPGIFLTEGLIERSFLKAGRKNIKYRVDVPAGWTSVKVEVYVNGNHYESYSKDAQYFADKTFEVDPRLKGRNSDVTIIATGSVTEGDDLSDSITINYRYEGTEIPNKLPILYGLAIGAGPYSDFPLEHTVKDAVDIVDAFKEQKGIVFSEVMIKTLIGKDVKKLDIIRELENLKKRAEDAERDLLDFVVLVFYSGHGVADREEQKFYLMPVSPLKVPMEKREKGVTDKKHYEEIGVSQHILSEIVKSIPGKKLLFFDACRSGNITMSRFINDINAYGSGRLNSYIFASTDVDDVAIECGANGCFTKAVLEGIRSKSVAQYFWPNTHTSTDDLDKYIHRMVPFYSKGKQRASLAVTNSELTPLILSKPER